MQPLSSVAAVRALRPFLIESSAQGPRRKSLTAPEDRGLFVKPMKQCFIRNPRLMPMTRVVLALLAGWSGDGRPIETTLGSIGRHVSRSTRQVQRYLKDAIEEGYLMLAYTKDRIGRITGLVLRLNRLALLHTRSRPEDRRQAAAGLATTPRSPIKGKHLSLEEESSSTPQAGEAASQKPDTEPTASWERLGEGANPFTQLAKALAQQAGPVTERDRARERLRNRRQ